MLTLTNYNLPSDCSAILSEALGKTLIIQDWANNLNLSGIEEPVIIILEQCEDLLNSVYKKKIILSSQTVFISQNFSLAAIYKLMAYDLLSFVDYNDLSITTLEAAWSACVSSSLFISKTIMALQHSQRPIEKKVQQVSRREIEIIDLISKELTTKEIASKLYLSKRTVDTHRQNLMRKLNVKNNVGLVKAALQRRLISFDTPSVLLR